MISDLELIIHTDELNRLYNSLQRYADGMDNHGNGDEAKLMRRKASLVAVAIDNLSQARDLH